MKRKQSQLKLAICTSLLIIIGSTIVGCSKPTFMKAACRGDVSAVERFINSGADVNESKSGWSPLACVLNYCYGSQSHVEVAKILIGKGANVNAIDSWQKTPLYYAIAYNCDPEIITMLLDNGAEPNLQSFGICSPLYHAIDYNLDLKIIEKLIDGGANPNNHNSNICSPLINATKSINKNSLEITKMLLAKGADPNVTDPSGYTPLLHIASTDNVDIAKLLIASGAKINVVAKNGMTPLGVAGSKGRVEMAKLFIERGADTIIALHGLEKYSNKKTLGLFSSSNATEEASLGRLYIEKYATKEEVTNTSALPSPKSSVIDTTPPVIGITSPEVRRGIKIAAREASVTVVGRATDANGVASVTVNKEQAALDEKGNFSAEILLKIGDNQIVITAIDVNRNQATERFTVVRQATAVAVSTKKATTSTAKGRNYAVIIGINQYKQIRKLHTAVHDAEAVANVLRDLYGFETRLILNEKATNDAILKELNSLRMKLKPSDRLLIYYAGHGVLDKETDASYWLPVDSELNDDTKWLDTKRITDQLKRITARQVLVVADSCYSGTISRAINVNLEGSDTRDNYLRKLQEKPSRILIASGGNEPVDDAGGKGHSVFAEVFINTLKNPEWSVFTASELLYESIRESVSGRAEQTPDYKVIRNSGHDGGDFVFVKVR